MIKDLESQTQKALDIEYHRQAAAYYDATVTSRFHFYHVHSLHPWVRKVVQQTPDACALDIGTGTGVVACTLARLGCKVEAIDHSADMLDVARARAQSMGVSDRIHFRTGDCESLPYDDESFDAVAIQGMLHHLPEIRPTLVEAIRVLKPGGQLYVSEPCIEGAIAGAVFNHLLKPAQWIRRLIAPPRQASVGEEVSDHERPVSGSALVATVHSLGLHTEVEYLVRLAGIRALPDRWRIKITLALSAPTRRTRGDLIFLVGHKPQTGGAVT